MQDLTLIIYDDPERFLPAIPPVVPDELGPDGQRHLENGAGNWLQGHIDVQVGQRLRELLDLFHLAGGDDSVDALVVSVVQVVYGH